MLPSTSHNSQDRSLDDGYVNQPYLLETSATRRDSTDSTHSDNQATRTLRTRNIMESKINGITERSRRLSTYRRNIPKKSVEELKIRRKREKFKRDTNLRRASYLRSIDTRLANTKVKVFDEFTFDLTPLKLNFIDPTDSLDIDTKNAHLAFYNIIIPTTELIDYIKSNATNLEDENEDVSIKILEHVADVYCRLAWQYKIESTCYLKKKWLDDKRFVVFARHKKPMPEFISTDMFWTRIYRPSSVVPYDAKRCPKPDLNRSTFGSLQNDSLIYVVGYKDPILVASMYPANFRSTRSQYIYKNLCKCIDDIDEDVLDYGLYAPIHGGLKIDLQKVYLEHKLNADIGKCSADKVLYMHNFELFVQACMKSICSIGGNDADSPIILHNVEYRNIIKSFATNRVFYYRNSMDYLCSMTVADDIFEHISNHRNIDEFGNGNNRLVYFYNIIDVNHIMTESGLQESEDLDNLCRRDYRDLNDMLSNCVTSKERLTRDILQSNRPPKDPFYEGIIMTMMDRAIESYSLYVMKSKSKRNTTYSTDIPNFTDNGRLDDNYVSEDSDEDAFDGDMYARQERRRARRMKTSVTVDTAEVSYTHKNGSTVSINVPVEGTQTKNIISTAISNSFNATEDSGDQQQTTGHHQHEEHQSKPAVSIIDEQIETVKIDINSTGEEGGLNIDFSYVERLKQTDKLVKVFKVKYNGNSEYIVEPLLNIVFHNMPICRMSRNFVKRVQTRCSVPMITNNEYANQGISSHFLERTLGEYAPPNFAASLELDILSNSRFSLPPLVVSPNHPSTSQHNDSTIFVKKIDNQDQIDLIETINDMNDSFVNNDIGENIDVIQPRPHNPYVDEYGNPRLIHLSPDRRINGPNTQQQNNSTDAVYNRLLVYNGASTTDQHNNIISFNTDIDGDLSAPINNGHIDGPQGEFILPENNCHLISPELNYGFDILNELPT